MMPLKHILIHWLDTNQYSRGREDYVADKRMLRDRNLEGMVLHGDPDKKRPMRPSSKAEAWKWYRGRVLSVHDSKVVIENELDELISSIEYDGAEKTSSNKYRQKPVQKKRLVDELESIEYNDLGSSRGASTSAKNTKVQKLTNQKNLSHTLEAVKDSCDAASLAGEPRQSDEEEEIDLNCDDEKDVEFKNLQQMSKSQLVVEVIKLRAVHAHLQSDLASTIKTAVAEVKVNCVCHCKPNRFAINHPNDSAISLDLWSPVTPSSQETMHVKHDILLKEQDEKPIPDEMPISDEDNEVDEREVQDEQDWLKTLSEAQDAMTLLSENKQQLVENAKTPEKMVSLLMSALFGRETINKSSITGLHNRKPVLDPKRVHLITCAVQKRFNISPEAIRVKMEQVKVVRIVEEF